LFLPPRIIYPSPETNMPEITASVFCHFIWSTFK
jgi:hypothetical protein